MAYKLLEHETEDAVTYTAVGEHNGVVVCARQLGIASWDFSIGRFTFDNEKPRYDKPEPAESRHFRTRKSVREEAMGLLKRVLASDYRDCLAS